MEKTHRPVSTPRPVARLFAQEGAETPWLASDLVDRLAGSDAPLLILGERGTGKTTLARQLHERSGRTGKFVAYQLGTASAALHLNDLFGHARGAFTGAELHRTGLVETAAGGTLFLDELGTASARVQRTLLSLLDQGEYRRQGEDRSRLATARIIAATNADLDALATRGRFRPDLLDRFGYFRIELPPLRRYRDHIVPLFLARLARHGAAPAAALTGEVRRLLIRAPWPGNLRQLDHVARYVAATLAPRTAVDVADLPPRFLQSVHVDPTAPLADWPSRILESLRRTGGNVSQAARDLGVDRRTVHRHLQVMRCDGRIRPPVVPWTLVDPAPAS